MNINEAYPSNYLKASDLKGRDVKVIIGRIIMEEVGGDHKPIVYFQGKEKGLVLNKTNAMNIAALYGPETDGWHGNPVVLYSAWVDFQGRSVEAIRVRPSMPQQEVRQQQPAPPAEAVPATDNLDDEIPF